MPGLTNNTNLLAAANQLIVAVNELSGRVSPDGSTIYGAISQVKGSIDNINTSLSDTNTIIENCCIGMQTKLGQIITAIRDIRLTGGGGLPTDGGGPFIDEPAIPIEDISDTVTVDEEACRRANYAYDFMADYLQECSSVNDLKNMSMAVIVTALVALFGSYFAIAVALTAAIEGATGLIVVFGSWSSMQYFGDLLQAFEADKDAIICELYNHIKNKNHEGVKNVFYNRTIEAVEDMLDTSMGLTEPMRDALGTSLPAVIHAFSSNAFANRILDEADADIEAYTPANPSDCSTCHPQEFLGWWIPIHNLALSVGLIPIDDVYKYELPLAQPPVEIYIGQLIDGFPSPLHTYHSHFGDPETQSPLGGVSTILEIISPSFVTGNGGGSIIFTIAGGGNGSPGADAQWHFYTYDNGVWSASLGNYGNGEHTVSFADTVTQAIISYYSPFTHSSPLPSLTDIQYTNITV